MHLSLFGPPRLDTGDGRVTTLPWQRPTALLVIAATHGAGIGRDTLAALLRPDADEATARAHLRRNLNRVRALLPAGALQADDRQVRWTGSCDVLDFSAAADAGDWERAIGLQPAPLLAGAGLLGDAAVDAWVDAERDRLRARLRVALSARLADPGGDDGQRAAWIGRLIDTDPLDETVLQTALEAACGPASRAAALAGCDQGLKRLRDELGLAPMQRTLALRERVAGSVAEASHSLPEARISPFAWADAAAPLLGRGKELDDIVDRLEGGAARLLTLVGLGGVGKTRLALAAAEAWSRRSGAPVLRIDLREVGSASALARAIAQAAGLPASSQPLQQVVDWMADAAVPRLLLLDNYEQLLADDDARQLPQRLAEAAPLGRVLVTSREALGLAGEHRIDVFGLDAAAALFAHHARRLGATLTADDGAAVAAICAALHGHPLGVELAASWLPVMRPGEILAEIRRGLDFLGDDEVAQDAHRSLRAVFARSWQLLAPRQRELLAALTVWRGGFDLEAARSVAAARLPELLQLAAKSLLQRAPDARFVLHPLVGQFAARELQHGQRAWLLDRHAEHYAQRVHAAGLGLGRADPAALRWLLADADNVGAAWWHAVAAARYDLIAVMHARLAALLSTGAFAREMVEQWSQAAAALPAEDPLRVQLELAYGGALVNLGRLDDAERVLMRLQPLVPSAGGQSILHAQLAGVAAGRGDLEAARRLTERSHAEARRSSNPYVRMRALHQMAAAALADGRVDDAELHAREMLELTGAHGANAYQARARRLMSSLRARQGRHDEARVLLAASSEFFASVVDAFELAVNDRLASEQARRRGDREAQLAAARRSATAMAALGVPAAHATCLYTLGLALADAGDAAAAEAAWLQALQLARKLPRRPPVVRTLGRLALLRLQGARRDEALAALAFALVQPGLPADERSELDAAFGTALPDAAARAALVAAATQTTFDEQCTRALDRG